MPLPFISRSDDLYRSLEIWRQQIQRSLNRAIRLKAPLNLRASSPTTTPSSNLIEWVAVRGADGYEIQRSDNGNFDTGAYKSTFVDNGKQTAFLDEVGASAITRYYRILALGGTVQEPHSRRGIPSAVIVATSNSGGTNYDGGTNDDWNRGGCCEVGTPLSVLAGNTIFIDVQPCSEWVEIELENGCQVPVALGTLVSTFQKAEDLQAGMLVEVEDGGFSPVKSVEVKQRPSYKMVAQVRPGRVYFGGRIRLHNLKF